MSHTLIALLCGLGLPVVIGMGIGLFAKFFPKEETFKAKIAPVIENFATATFILLGRWLKPSEMEKVDNGLFKTLAYWLSSGISVFMAKLDSLIAEAEAKK